MGRDWRDASLGELIRLQRGHDLTDSQRKPGEIPVMGSAGLNGYHNTSKAKGPGLVLGRSGASFGRVHYSISDYWPHNTALYVTDFLGNDELFTFHFLRTIDFSSYNSGSAQPSLNRNHIYLIPVKIPPLPEQKAIAHILGSLDDKIELNRRMNATLEGMAQALFKSWFVDFDPVIDNAIAAGNPIPEELAERAEVRRKALTDGTANREAAKQFPAAFQLTEEMGWIPEGWEERSISECFQLIGGHSFKSSGYVEGGRYGVVTIKNVQEGKFVEECTNRITVLPDKMKDHCRLNAGDVLLSLTGNVGRVCIVSEGSYVLNQRVSKIVGIDGISESFAYFFFRQGPFYEKMIVIAKGTAQQNLSPIETEKLKQVLPDNKTIRSLSSGFDAIFKKTEGNTAENMTLQKLRDTLLPKLISGELRILEADKIAEEALV